jgi:predicted dithiol-disulfide oxidoreductase (DUF899 family)
MWQVDAPSKDRAFGPDYTLGACPVCTSLGDGLDGSLVHRNHGERRVERQQRPEADASLVTLRARRRANAWARYRLFASTARYRVWQRGCGPQNSSVLQ